MGANGGVGPNPTPPAPKGEVRARPRALEPKWLRDENLVIKTPSIITECYGIPREGSFYLTDKSRSFYKLPFCHERVKYNDELSYNDIKDFYNKLKEIDNFFFMQ